MISPIKCADRREPSVSRHDDYVMPTSIDGVLVNETTADAPPLASGCPRLPPVFSVLLCGNQADWPQPCDQLRKRIRELLIQAFAYAKEAFEKLALYDKSPPRLRIVITCSRSPDVSVPADVASELGAELIVISSVGPPDAVRNTEGAYSVCFDLPSSAEASAADMAMDARDLLALAHADLVIAVWNPTGHAAQGSSLGIINRAVLARKPVVWVEAVDKLRLDLHLLDRASLLDRRLLPLYTPGTLADYLRNCFGGFDPASLRREVILQLAPQEEASKEPGPHDIDDLVAARLPGRIWQGRSGALDACLWSVVGLQGGRTSLEMLRLVAGNAGLRLHQRVYASMRAARADQGGAALGLWRPMAQAAKQMRAAWSQEAAMMAVSPAEDADPMFAWMDGMATFTAGRHRATIWLMNILAALAVLLAVWASTNEPLSAWGEIAALLELGALGAILLLLWLAFDRRWHRRWLFCRAVAEQLRAQHVLAGSLSISPAATRSPWRRDKDGLVLVDTTAWLVQRWLIGQGFARVAGTAGLVRLDALDVDPLRRTLKNFRSAGWRIGAVISSTSITIWNACR